MKSVTIVITATFALLLSGAALPGAIRVVIERNDTTTATPSFKFRSVPSSCMNDAATKAEFALVDGAPDDNGGGLGRLHDGKLPTEEDEPAENFFFNAGTEGGRLLVDLGAVIDLKQVNTYSWHPGPRGPQVYSLYGSNGESTRFNARPKNGIAPEKCGWKLIAKVDTRPEHEPAGGQYGVSIFDPAGAIGKYRYLLFVISRTEDRDDFGNTFYSEIDVIDGNAPEPLRAVITAPPPRALSQTFASGGGDYQITIDPSGAPDLTEWAFKELAPVAQEWYPKIIKLLPSKGFQVPARVTIDFGNATARYVAITRGNHITCNTRWFRENLRGEAIGCVVHEIVHVVQHYGGGQPEQPNAPPVPGWLAEGIPDYIRWFIYEPQAHGADFVWMRRQKNLNPSYDGSYRISANFLNWVTEKYDKELVRQLNAALREGTYGEDFWQQRTGHSVEELGADWQKGLAARLEAK